MTRVEPSRDFDDENNVFVVMAVKTRGARCRNHQRGGDQAAFLGDWRDVAITVSSDSSTTAIDIGRVGSSSAKPIAT